MVQPNPIRINPALRELAPLVGHWDIEISNARFLPDPSVTIRGGEGIVEWIEGGDFLVMRQGNKQGGPPYSTSIIGRDESEKDFQVFYFDDRGVSRIYRMSFNGSEWRQWRESPGFFQRFQGTLSRDGNTITASWELSENGSKWLHDFDLTYTKKHDDKPSHPD